MEKQCCNQCTCSKKAKEELQKILKNMEKNLEFAIFERKNIQNDFRNLEDFINIYTCSTIGQCLTQKLEYVRSKVKRFTLNSYLSDSERNSVRMFISSIKELSLM